MQSTYKEKKMRIIAADDEIYALQHIVNSIKEAAPDAELHSFMSAREVLEYAKDNPCDVAFLDVQMGAVSGIDVAKQLKIWQPKVNIVFVTGYDEYMNKAIRLHVSGYVGKPATKDDIAAELNNLLNPVMPEEENKLVAKCFGNFDVFVNGKSLVFEKSKTKEMLAYLIDRRGAAVTSGELRAVLWQDVDTDDNTHSYLSKIKKDLLVTLNKAGLGDVFVTSWNRYAVNVEKISCDYYNYLNNEPEGIKAFNGEYMSQYSWAMLKYD